MNHQENHNENHEDFSWRKSEILIVDKGDRNSHLMIYKISWEISWIIKKIMKKIIKILNRENLRLS